MTTAAATSPDGTHARRGALPRSRARLVDYAALTGAWGAASTTLAWAAARRGGGGPAPADLPVLGLATFAVARTVSRERVESWLREPFVEETADGRQLPRGEGPRYAIGELLACTRCTGTWAALAVTAGWLLAPRGGRAVVGALAVAGANDFLQAGFARIAGSGGSPGPGVTTPR